MYTEEGYSFSRTMYVARTCCWSRLYVSIRKVLRPAISAQVLLGFPLSISECWDGSQDSKLLLHASHATHQDQIKTPQIYVCYVWYVCKAATGRQSNCNKEILLTYLLKDISTFHTLPTFYIFILINFLTYIKECDSSATFLIKKTVWWWHVKEPEIVTYKVVYTTCRVSLYVNKYSNTAQGDESPEENLSL